MPKRAHKTSENASKQDEFGDVSAGDCFPQDRVAGDPILPILRPDGVDLEVP
jgi:hypothetical protein